MIIYVDKNIYRKAILSKAETSTMAIAIMFNVVHTVTDMKGKVLCGSTIAMCKEGQGQERNASGGEELSLCSGPSMHIAL